MQRGRALPPACATGSTLPCCLRRCPLPAPRPSARTAGQRLEPLEEVVCEVEDANAGEVIEAVTLRKGEVGAGHGGAEAARQRPCGWLVQAGRPSTSAGAPSPSLSLNHLAPGPCLLLPPTHPRQLLEMLPLETEGKQRLVFECPSRGLIGFRSAFATITRGTGVLHRAFAR